MNIAVQCLPPKGVELTFDEAGTHYMVLLGLQAGGSVFIAWPDGKWSYGHLSTHAPPEGAYLCSAGLKSRADANAIAKAVAAAWSLVTGSAS